MAAIGEDLSHCTGHKFQSEDDMFMPQARSDGMAQFCLPCCQNQNRGEQYPTWALRERARVWARPRMGLEIVDADEGLGQDEGVP